MTYTVLGRCQRTGRVGIGIATFSITVGRYCYGVKSNAGVTVSQAFANERNNALALRLLTQGFTAQSVLQQLMDNDPYAQYRQIGVIDRSGMAVARVRAGMRDRHAAAVDDADLPVLGIRIVRHELLQHRPRSEALRQQPKGQRVVPLVGESLAHRHAGVRLHAVAIAPDGDRESRNADSHASGPVAAAQYCVGH